MKRSARRLILFSKVLLVVGVSFGIIACDRSNNESGSGQALAKVNDDEITVHQLNYELSQHEFPPDMDAKEVMPGILKSLVEQQLLVQKAKETRLDRNPEVVQAIQRATKRILARAYLEQVMSTVSSPGEEEVNRYYQEHPEWFAERRIYEFEELSISSDGAITGLEEKLKDVETFEELASWLTERKIAYREGKIVKKAEELPNDFLEQAFKMSVGQVAIVSAGGRIVVLQLSNSKQDPLTLEQASPLIRKRLSDGKRKASVAGLMSRLHQNATIEYKGEFAKNELLSAPASRAQEDEEVSSDPEEVSSDPEEVSSDPMDGRSYIDRGISGK